MPSASSTTGHFACASTACTAIRVPEEIPKPQPIKTASMAGSRFKICDIAASLRVPSLSGNGKITGSFNLTASIP